MTNIRPLLNVLEVYHWWEAIPITRVVTTGVSLKISPLTQHANCTLVNKHITGGGLVISPLTVQLS